MRFYVETSDEHGPTEYDSFKDVQDALKLARELLSVGFKYAVVVDRVNLIAVKKFGQLPHDWQ